MKYSYLFRRKLIQPEMYLNKEVIGSYQTPYYYYDLELLKTTLADIVRATDRPDYHVHYAFKANANQPVLDLISDFGLGADCVSGNEIEKAIDSGFSSHSVVFAGVGKTDSEICFALVNDIFCFNCESIQEIEVINELAGSLSKKARIAIRINPDINACTHEYITTGLNENKFGIPVHQLNSVLEKISASPNVILEGIHFHIGSQITKMYVFRELCAKINRINLWFKEKGIDLNHINVGGGLGIDYEFPQLNPIPDFTGYFDLFGKFLDLLPGQDLHFELGRSVVGQCGTLVTKVLYIKEGVQYDFVVCDAGMTELMRPALYDAVHRIDNLSSIFTKTDNYTVVGPVCESSDCFGKGLQMPVTQRGDLLAIRSAGAYGEVMASSYNLRDKVNAVYMGSDQVLVPSSALTD